MSEKNNPPVSRQLPLAATMGTSNVRVLLRVTCIDLETVTSRLNLFLSTVWTGVDDEDKSETLEACARYDAIRCTLDRIVSGGFPDIEAALDSGPESLLADCERMFAIQDWNLQPSLIPLMRFFVGAVTQMYSLSDLCLQASTQNKLARSPRHPCYSKNPR